MPHSQDGGTAQGGEVTFVGGLLRSSGEDVSQRGSPKGSADDGWLFPGNSASRTRPWCIARLSGG